MSIFKLLAARSVSMRDTPAYSMEDFEIMRAITEAARFTPGLWLLNRISKLWLDAARELRFAIRPPEDYVSAHSKYFDLVDDGRVDEAVAHMTQYLERHDEQLTKALQVLG